MILFSLLQGCRKLPFDFSSEGAVLSVLTAKLPFKSFVHVIHIFKNTKKTSSASFAAITRTAKKRSEI